MSSNALRFIAVLFAVGCGPRGPKSPAASPAATAAGARPDGGPAPRTPVPPSSGARTPFTGTIGLTDVARQGMPSELVAVRAAEHFGYDRVVFEFRGAVPGYHIEYGDHPVRDCGAGDPRSIAGDAWLEVRFYPANAHDEQGRPTVEARELRPNLANVIEVERTCDFEAVVTWVLGTKSPNRYRVLELSQPSRLALDVEH